MSDKQAVYLDNRSYAVILLYTLPFVLMLLSLFVGRYHIPVSSVISELFLSSRAFLLGISLPMSTNHTVLFSIRLPRIIAALLVGSALSVAGASFQGVFQNPLVSPYILGVGAGAGFGACLGILLSDSYMFVQLLAFIFGLLAMFSAILMGKVSKGAGNLVFVLSGIIVGSIFTSLISLAKYIADPYDDLPEIVFWLMGSLSSVRYVDVLWLAIPLIIGITILLLLRWRINVLTLGDEEAKSLGVDIDKMRLVIIICATLVTSAAVSLSGIIGWVGLVVPHIARMLVGPNYVKLLPASIAIGASFLLLVDDLARTMTATEIPLGIITSLVGAPLFAYLIKRGRLGWN
ncbi:MAG: iron ABC transporter permease [Methanolobus sp.]|nr:iron ABC transporter permease [Methanolobus sp.]